MATISLPQLAIVLGDMESRVSNVRPVLKAGAISGISEIKQRFQDSKGPDGTVWPPLKHPRPNSKGGDKPLLDTGQLQASFAHTLTDNSLTIGTAKPQAALMNFGGTVRPVKAKWLTIPLTTKAMRAGSPKNFNGILFPRINKAKSGGVMVDAFGVAQYAMTKKVVIPPRPFMGFSDAWREIFSLSLLTYVTTGKL